MATRIQISTTVRDTRAAVRTKRLQTLGFNIDSVLLLDIYTIDKKLTKEQTAKVISLLVNPVTQKTVDSVTGPFSYAVEIGFLPGVTDNVGNTAKETIEDGIGDQFAEDEHVYSSQVMFLCGQITGKDAELIGKNMANPLIQRITVIPRKDYEKNGLEIVLPKVILKEKTVADRINLNVSDEELALIGKLGILNKDGTRRGPLALNLEYMKTIQQYFRQLGRDPSDVELESIAQTWSEHCKHTIFADPMDEAEKGLFRTYIKAATEKINSPLCVSVFSDNSGGIQFDENYVVTHKTETHNSPSALDPFGGAVTGIVGVNRDALGFGLGAKPVINTYGFCFADPDDTKPLYKGKRRSQEMLSPRRIMNGVVEGVNAGGNQSGIPCPQGFMYFHDRYKGKPLVFVGTVGLIPKKIQGGKSYIKRAKPGDYIVMIGGRVGLDGIHGATFSSEALSEGSPATAVQIGDPITQKKLSDAIVKEARDAGLFNSITDNGAGGLSCSVAEMAKECNGCSVQLEKVPLKYPGLAPWQIWISESQERMTLAVPKDTWKRFYGLMSRRGVEATVIGEFNDSGFCTVTYNAHKIMDIDLKFLHNGLPQRSLTTQLPPVAKKVPHSTWGKNLTSVFTSFMARRNMAGYEFVSMQYDHEVQAGSVLKPLQGKGRVNADVSITRPLLYSQRGVALSQALYPSYTEINAYNMAAASIDTAVRNLIAAGVPLHNIAILDNFCWCSPDDPKRLYQLKRAAEACYDYAVAYGTPFISGKDSMYNDFHGFDEKNRELNISILPTLLISSIGIIENIYKSVSIDSKFSGDLIYILGETFEELGGTEFYLMQNVSDNMTPRVNAGKNKELYNTYIKAVDKELVSSAVSIGRGGFAAALSRTLIAGQLGAQVSLKKLPGLLNRNEAALFSETQGRILVTVAPDNRVKFEKIMKDIPFAFIGKTVENSVTIEGLHGKTVVETDIETLSRQYKSTFQDY